MPWIRREAGEGRVTQIVCACKNLVEVVDGLVVEHAREGGERCLASGMRHVSQKSTRCPSQVWRSSRWDPSSVSTAERWAWARLWWCARQILR